MDPEAKTNEDNVSSCDEDEYIVEKIVDKKITETGQILYFIKWKDWSSAFNTWEPIENCKCPDLIEEYEKNIARKNSLQTKSSTKKITKRRIKYSSNKPSSSFAFSSRKTDLNKCDKNESENKVNLTSDDTSGERSSTYNTREEMDKCSIKLANKKKPKQDDFMSDNYLETKMLENNTSILKNTTLSSDSSLSSEDEQENYDKKFGFEQGYELETLLGVNVINNQLLFYVKYANSCYHNELIPASICNEKWPEKVIEFYQARLLTMKDDIDLEILWKEVNDNKSRTHPRNM